MAYNEAKLRGTCGWHDLAGWVALVRQGADTEQSYFARAALIRSLDNADIRACKNADALHDFLDLVGAARRGATGSASALIRHLPRNRLSSLAQEAEDQLDRLYLFASGEESLDQDMTLLMACLSA